MSDLVNLAAFIGGCLLGMALVVWRTRRQRRTTSTPKHPSAMPLALGRNHMKGNGDVLVAHLSPAEPIILGPNGPIHIRGAYGDEPVQVTEIDPDDIEEERT